MWYKAVGWIHLVQDIDQWYLVETVANLWVSERLGISSPNDCKLLKKDYGQLVR